MRPTANNDYQGPTVDAHPGLVIGPVVGTVAIALAALFYDTAELTGVFVATVIIIACAIGTYMAARATHRQLDRKLEAEREAKKPEPPARDLRPILEDAFSDVRNAVNQAVDRAAAEASRRVEETEQHSHAAEPYRRHQTH